ncbi:MAG: right-handed parallel beta-helix repeat-containing protein [Bacteroidota bacterium]
MRMFILSATLLLLEFLPAYSTTWPVGPTRTYTAPSKVSALVENGDTVAIDAGVYTLDVTRWTASNLVLRGIGGYAHLNAGKTSFGGKAIWVISGNNTTVESVEFSDCSCPDHNGAGIRQEGNNLTVRGCYFHDNEDGILGGGDATSSLVIEHSEFSHNGFGDGYSHNLYIGNIYSLTFQFNYSHGAVIGHELKSRAHRNYILYNRISNEATGTASREIDLPNGGTAIIIGNEIQQGSQGTNSGIIGYGLEGLSNPTPHRLTLVYNTIVNEKGSGTFVAVQEGSEFFKSLGNIFAGPGTLLSGSAYGLDTVGNLALSVSACGFVDPSNYDYHLASSSPLIDQGTDPGSEGTYSLAPASEYLHPASGEGRAINGGMDIGAHEYHGAAGIAVHAVDAVVIDIRPNPFSSNAIISCSVLPEHSLLIISDAMGNDIRRISLKETGSALISRDGLPAGIYFGRIIGSGGNIVGMARFVIE